MSQKTPTPRDWREGRRIRAWELKQKGWKQREIAEALGVSEGAVSQWMRRAREGGVESLRHVSPPGPSSRLSSPQQQCLLSMLSEGAEAFGFQGQVWTGPRVAQLIKDHFGIAYHPKYIPRLLKALGWSRQKPRKKATQQDEEAVAAWREQTWPEVKKRAEVEARTLVPVDEAAFSLLPAVVRTWAPRGCPPILKEVYSHDHLSAISAITPTGKLYMQLHEEPIDGWDVVRFLCHLLRHIPGKLLILWDQAKIHGGEAVRQLLCSNPDQDIWLEPFPPYAPELNPDEGIWNYLKNVELRNLCCQTLAQVREEVHKAVKRLRHKPYVITGCFRQAGLEL
jgi:transposase